ncbi:MAG TPA: hypothetical protein VMG41_16070 [Gemmatimonadales bacterium]|nr:hypothetical protein [Gemmatimonadales bacterium]
MLTALIVAVSCAVAWFTYWRLERLGRRAWGAALARGLAWSALGMLLLDPAWTTHGGGERPVVLLDGSLSMVAAGGRWQEAHDSALVWGEVRLFGDRRPGVDSMPAYGRSDLGLAIAAAAASDRRVIVVTDGELTDPTDVAPEALARAAVRLFPRSRVPDVAVTRLSGPERVTVGDTVHLEAEVRAFGAPAESASVEARVGDRVLAHRTVRLGPDAAVEVPLAFGSRGLTGDVLLTVGLSGAHDAEPRDDAREWIVRVVPTPGIVVIADPSDWDGRFLFRTLRDVGELPIRGYMQLEPGRWRSMETLVPVGTEEVRAATRRAQVLVLKGAEPAMVKDVRAPGTWLWPSGEDGAQLTAGDWYAVASPISPIAGAFVGAPVDSFPPLFQVEALKPAPGPETWVGISAQLGRRGAPWPVLVGQASGGRRRVMTAADGVWRWAFRGGSSEEAYRSLVAATLSWLLGGADSSAARARVLHAVVPNARPVQFQWVGPGKPAPLGVSLTRGDREARDTLRFDGSGRADLWLPTGTSTYRLDGGGEGLLAVDTWSDEWLPRAVTLKDQPVSAEPAAGRTSTRRWIWLFALAVIGLTAEWLIRRKLGLR